MKASGIFCFDVEYKTAALPESKPKEKKVSLLLPLNTIKN